MIAIKLSEDFLIWKDIMVILYISSSRLSDRSVCFNWVVIATRSFQWAELGIDINTWYKHRYYIYVCVYIYVYVYIYASQVAQVVKKKKTKNLLANEGDLRDRGLIPGLRRSPWRKAWQPTPVFLPGESHGQRSLVGYIHSLTKSWTRLKRLSMHACIIHICLHKNNWR